MKIDRIFIINLKHRRDRKEKIIKELEKISETNYEFFDAIKPDQHDLDNWNPSFCTNKQKDNPCYNKYGALGCMLSHIEIMRMSLERGYDNILILEDDTIFNNTLDILDTYLHNTSFNIDILYLFGTHMEYPKKITEHIYKVTGLFTTSSYIINNRTMKYILENISCFDEPIDVYYRNVIQKKFDCYITMPHITSQIPSFSDIENTHVSYRTQL